MLVLVVEDDAMIRELAVEHLQDAGLRTIEAADAEAALDLLENDRQVALVVTDIAMPGDIDGVDLAQRVAQRWPRMPVVVTSGVPSARLEAVRGRVTFLRKPYRAGELVAAVIRGLAHPSENRSPGAEPAGASRVPAPC